MLFHVHQPNSNVILINLFSARILPLSCQRAVPSTNEACRLFERSAFRKRSPVDAGVEGRHQARSRPVQYVAWVTFLPRGLRFSPQESHPPAGASRPTPFGAGRAGCWRTPGLWPCEPGFASRSLRAVRHSTFAARGPFTQTGLPAGGQPSGRRVLCLA